MMKNHNYLINLIVIFCLYISFAACQKEIIGDSRPLDDGILSPLPDATLGVSNDALPYPSKTPVVYPSPYPDWQATVTPSPAEITPQQATVILLAADMTPVAASEEMLATAIGNFEHYFRDLPFINAAKGRPHREYFGCIDSQNAGSMIDYSVNIQSAEDIKNTLVEYFDEQKINHSDWEEFEISGFLGYSWTISASKYLNDNTGALVIIRADLLEYRLRATSEPFELPIPTEDTGFPASHIKLWLNFVDAPDQNIGFKQTDLLKTCKEGWWLAINP